MEISLQRKDRERIHQIARRKIRIKQILNKTPFKTLEGVTNLSEVTTPDEARITDPNPNDCRTPGRLLGWQDSWPRGWARQVVTQGLRWKWLTGIAPRLGRFRHYVPASENLQEKIQKLLEKDVIEETKDKIYLNRLFEVPKKDSEETRLVLDTSALNKHIQTYKFRMVTTKTVRHALFQDAYIACIDLKDAYWHIPIHKRMRPFLGFRIGRKSYRFKVLPFGLNLAPRVFTKIMKVVQRKLVLAGVNIIMYLDDWMIIAPSYQECKEMIEKTLQIGKEMGLLFNMGKSILEPCKMMDWLGLYWNTVQATVALSRDNQEKCLSKSLQIMNSTQLTLRQWESLIGSLNHAADVVPLGRLYVRKLILLGKKVFSTNHRDRLEHLPRRIKNALKWWADEERLASATPWVPRPPSLTLTTDASDWGWGYQSSEGHQDSGPWNQSWKNKHINLRELQTVLIAIQ